MAAPAILTSASALMALSTGNRFGRVLDRVRSTASAIKALPVGSKDREIFLRMLDRNERRGDLLVRSLRSFYFSLSCFAGASLISMLGASAEALSIQYLGGVSVVIAFLGGIVGVARLLLGCVLLLRETSMALLNMKDETDFIRRQATL